MNHRVLVLIIALFLASLNLRPAISSISPLLESIRNDLGISASLASLLTSVPLLCMGIFSPMAVRFGAKWGLERIVAIALLVTGLGILARWTAASALFLVITAFIAGIGIAVCGPLLSGFIKRHFPAHVPMMIGIYSVALTIGAALGSGLSVPLLSVMNDSWRSALSLWAIPAFLALPFWLYLAKGERASHESSNPTGESIHLPWTNKRAWLITFFFGLMSIVFYSIMTWLAPMVEGMGYSQIYAATVLSLFVLLQIPSSFLIPMLIQRYPNRVPWLIGCVLLNLTGVVCLVSSVSPLFAAILFGIGTGGLFPLALMLPIDETASSQGASSWSAMTQTVGYIIGALGPIMVGWVHDITGSYTHAFFILGVIIIAMIGLILAIGRQPRKLITLSEPHAVQDVRK